MYFQKFFFFSLKLKHLKEKKFLDNEDVLVELHQNEWEAA